MPKVTKTVSMNIQDCFDQKLNWMTVRITDKKIKLKKLKKFAKQVNAVKWVCGYEISHKEVKHSHLVLGIHADMSDYDWKKAIKSAFRVEGNQGFSKSRVRTSQYRAIQYCIKDGDYESEGFDKEILTKIKVQSTKKFQKDEFKEALTSLETKYYIEDMSFREFSQRYYAIRIMYGQKPNRNSITNYLLYHYHKVDPQAGDKFIDNIVQRIKFDHQSFNSSDEVVGVLNYQY